MKRRIIDTVSAVSIGAVASYAFFSLYGIIASFSIDKKISHWIFKVPADFRKTAFFIHEIFLQFLAILPLVAVLGLILGLVVIKKPARYGLISFGAAILMYIFVQFILYDFGFVGLEYIHIWVYCVQFILWAVLFVSFPVLGFKSKSLISQGNK